jgi:predicted RNA-binding protein YlxR (DUF448 family)
MAHHIKSSKPNRASKKTVRCTSCGKSDIPDRMKREPPGHGEYICDNKECRAKAKERHA